jgi:hypothetical protein
MHHRFRVSFVRASFLVNGSFLSKVDCGYRWKRRPDRAEGSQSVEFGVGTTRSGATGGSTINL